MSLLNQLWDDTVAGPPPEKGLGKLRKFSTFGSRTDSGKEADFGNGRSYVEESTEEPAKVTRSIRIVKPSGAPSPGNGSPVSSPAGSTPPLSPFFGGKDGNRFRRKSMSDAGGYKGPAPTND